MDQDLLSDQGTLGAEFAEMRIKRPAEGKTKMNDGRKDPDSELAALRQAVEWVTNGLRQMLEVQATHTLILQSILDAATSPGEPEQELAETLAQMVLSLGEQTKILAQIHAIIAEPAPGE